MSDTRPDSRFDPAKAEAFAGRLLLALNDGALCLMASVGHRTGAETYRYESDGGRFVADLRVSPAAFVTHTPGLWAPDPARSGTGGSR